MLTPPKKKGFTKMDTRKETDLFTFQHFSPERSYAMAEYCAPSGSSLINQQSLANYHLNAPFTYPYVAIGSFLRPRHQKLSETHDSEKNLQFRYTSLFTSIFRLSPHRMDRSPTVWLITVVKNPELLIGCVGGGLRSSRSPFLLQGLLVVLPEFSLQLFSVVKEVH